jgi:hypothetical protein
LDTLFSVLVEPDKILIETFINLIRDPDTIEDTNRFASILVALQCNEFINPIVEIIYSRTHQIPTWLSDYLYALGSILEDNNPEYQFQDYFIHQLGFWIQSANVEVSWKSAVVLSNIDNPLCYDYYITGVRNTMLFHQTRIACLNGIVNHYGLKEWSLYQELLLDPDPVFQESVRDAIEYLGSAIL